MSSFYGWNHIQKSSASCISPFFAQGFVADEAACRGGLFG
jgi:hypothetical protein